jgi:hypothetical protein
MDNKNYDRFLELPIKKLEMLVNTSLFLLKNKKLDKTSHRCTTMFQCRECPSNVGRGSCRGNEFCDISKGENLVDCHQSFIDWYDSLDKKKLKQEEQKIISAGGITGVNPLVKSIDKTMADLHLREFTAEQLLDELLRREKLIEEE